MTAAPGQHPEDYLDFAAYLAMQERSELRHEFVAGRVILMSGGTRAHDQAAFFLARRLPEADDKQGHRSVLGLWRPDRARDQGEPGRRMG